MSERIYKPLRGHSPSLQPHLSTERSDSGGTEMLHANSNDYGRPATPSDAGLDNTDHDSFRYGGGGHLISPNGDIEAEVLMTKDIEKLPQTYRMYKRRWIGLAVLTLHSFAIGWGFTAPSVVAETAAEWYSITLKKNNDLSIISDLVFLIPAPFIIWALNRLGPKWSMVISMVFTAIGSWVIYGGAALHDFNVNIAGSIIHAMASGFSLCAPTRYSRLWFDDHSRTLATALPSLSYLLGCGFGAAVGPYMVQPVGPLAYDQQALIIAITLTAVSIPGPFIPNKPPTPPSTVAKLQGQLNAKDSILTLLKNKPFYLQLLTFSIFAGAIETTTNVTVQALRPYAYTQQEAANAISLLVFVGIACACILSPILDRTKQHANAIRVLSTVVAIAYTALPWVPSSRSVVPLYATFAIIGAASISLEPAVLEHQASRIHPVSPEYASVMTFSGMKVTIAVLTTLVGVVLPQEEAGEGQPAGSLFNGLWLLAGLAWFAAGCSFLNGRWIFKRPEESRVEGNDG